MTDLVCVICLYAKEGRPNDAELIINGQSVCVPHAGYVQGGEASRAIALAKEQQQADSPDMAMEDR